MTRFNLLTLKYSSRQQGFTLVEVSMVLIIVALLTGAIIGGQKMIETARYNKLVEQIDAYRAAVMAFERRYNYLPGDFPEATTRLVLPTGVTTYNGDGDGIISGGDDTIGDGNEAPNAIQHLKLAGLIPGDPSEANQSQVLPVGGFINRIVTLGRNNQSVALEIKSMPRKFIMRLEHDLDDGYGTTGTILDYNGGDYPSTVNDVGYIFVRL